MTKKDKFWYADGAFILYTRRSLFPVFRSGAAGFPLPEKLEKILAQEGLHAAQGTAADIDLLGPLLESSGIFASETNDYDLMDFDEPPRRNISRRDWNGLIRRPLPEDLDALFPLQAAYEHEEVIPKEGVFYPAACRKTLETMIAAGRILAAESDGRLVGKINVNAESFTRFQIGGVYVDPAFRGRGIARAMTAELIRRLSPLGKGFTLFVKKNNAPARAVYEGTGFSKTGSYKIAYYVRRFPSGR
jgi:ribosomal protein S18 acetylase RimI-like enzyme